MVLDETVRLLNDPEGGTPVDLPTIDWNEAWKSLRNRKGSSVKDSRFWDGRASTFAVGASEAEYAEGFLAIMKPQPEWTVLDMGCGSGTLAIPLAKSVAAVTAVDFSSGMLDVLRNRCMAQGISNVATIEASWEDDWKALGIGPHDVAVASRSMVAHDLRASIVKLSNVARRMVYIVTTVGDGPYDRRLFEEIGRPFKRGPDYIYNYNLLYQMGIYANIAFIKERRERIYDSIDHASEALGWMVGKVTAKERKKLATYLRRETVSGRPDPGKLAHTTQILWAVIWWEKE